MIVLLIFQVDALIKSSVTPKMREDFLIDALNKCLQRGITHVQTNDAEGFWDVYNSIHAAGNLPIRVSLTPNCMEIINSE
jgi:predicted amidohydrolase YtcJ